MSILLFRSMGSVTFFWNMPYKIVDFFCVSSWIFNVVFTYVLDLDIDNLIQLSGCAQTSYTKCKLSLNCSYNDGSNQDRQI